MQKSKKTAEPQVARGDYDTVVVVTKGQHKGEIGLYDDDASPSIAVVYFKSPFKSNPITIRRSSLRLATEDEDNNWRREHFPHESPDIKGALPEQLPYKAESAVALSENIKDMMNEPHTGVEIHIVVWRKADGSEVVPHTIMDYGDGVMKEDAVDVMNGVAAMLQPGEMTYLQTVTIPISELLQRAKASINRKNIN
jgi:hypothetical protein